MTRFLVGVAPVWLIVLIIGLPKLSENAYSPALPSIVVALNSTERLVEFSISIFLIAFSLGVLFWGNISDRHGRKPCLLIGLIIFIIGCFGCFFSQTIEHLLISRFVQAFGGSVCSVIGQSLSRDSYNGKALSKVYSIVGSALSVFLAIGPVIGGFIADHLAWNYVFLALAIFSIAIFFLLFLFLPETLKKEHRISVSMKKVFKVLVRDRKVLNYGFLVGGCNGLIFAFYGEGSFYMINLLGLSPVQYGMMFILLAASTVAGGIISSQLLSVTESKTILSLGLWGMMVASFSFMTMAMLSASVHFHNDMMIAIATMSMMLFMCASCIVTSIALSLALLDYRQYTGTASSLFGSYYYIITSMIAFGIVPLHNKSLTLLPTYLTVFCALMLISTRFTARKQAD